jgi:hypothetical protein
MTIARTSAQKFVPRDLIAIKVCNVLETTPPKIMLRELGCVRWTL